jgi:Protein of unknown function (DUF2490)
MLRDNPSSRTARAALLAAGLLLSSARLRAQAAAGGEPTVWLTYAGEHAITRGGTALVLDAHVRRGDAFAEWRQLLLRTGLSRGVGRRVRVAGGWAYLRTFENGETGVPYAVWDHRAWQMVQLSHGIGRVSLVHRARLEQRFFRADPEVAGGDWSFAWRGRLQARATTRLPGALGARAYALASGELFAPFGPHVGTPEVDQSRVNVGIGTRVSPTLRLEVGYLNRAAVDDGRARTRDHALQVAIASGAPFIAGRRRPAP